MKKAILVLLLSILTLFTNAKGSIPFDDSSTFGRSQWIGAISKGYYDDVIINKKTTDSLYNRSILLRKDFNVGRRIKKAVVCVCGLGFYELSINGKKVGDADFAPLWSNYDKSVFYNTYDVT